MQAKECYFSVGSAKRLIQLKPVLDSSPTIAAIANEYNSLLTKKKPGCNRCKHDKSVPAFNFTNKMCEAIRSSSDECKKLVAGFLHASKVMGHVSGSTIPVVLIDLK